MSGLGWILKEGLQFWERGFAENLHTEWWAPTTKLLECKGPSSSLDPLGRSVQETSENRTTDTQLLESTGHIHRHKAFNMLWVQRVAGNFEGKIEWKTLKQTYKDLRISECHNILINILREARKLVPNEQGQDDFVFLSGYRCRHPNNNQGR